MWEPAGWAPWRSQLPVVGMQVRSNSLCTLAVTLAFCIVLVGVERRHMRVECRMAIMWGRSPALAARQDLHCSSQHYGAACSMQDSVQHCGAACSMQDSMQHCGAACSISPKQC